MPPHMHHHQPMLAPGHTPFPIIPFGYAYSTCYPNHSFTTLHLTRHSHHHHTSSPSTSTTTSQTSAQSCTVYMTHPHTNTPPATQGGTQASRSQSHTPPLMPGSQPLLPSSQHYSHHTALSMPPALPKKPHNHANLPFTSPPPPPLFTTGQPAHPLLTVHTPANHCLLNQLLH